MRPSVGVRNKATEFNPRHDWRGSEEGGDSGALPNRASHGADSAMISAVLNSNCYVAHSPAGSARYESDSAPEMLESARPSERIRTRGSPGMRRKDCRVTSYILLKPLTNPPGSLDTACYRGIRRCSFIAVPIFPTVRHNSTHSTPDTEIIAVAFQPPFRHGCTIEMELATAEVIAESAP